MKYFDSILARRNKVECPLPLWELKIRDEEFEELRTTLCNCTKDRFHENPFIYNDCEKEATLFFAEYWRRLYVGGPHSIQMVYEALGDVPLTKFWTDAFYEAACNGAQQLGIEQYKGGHTIPLNDMLYQGGLPMKLVTGDIYDSNWNRFTQGLVNRKFNFEDLDLGLMASQSKSLRDYCSMMYKGIVTAQFKSMPFFCQNEYDSWYVYLIELYKGVTESQRLSQPFSLTFEFDVDKIGKGIHPYYVLNGPQRLSERFLKEQNLENKTFISMQVRENGHPKDPFDFKNGFCHYPVKCRHPYHHNDYVSLFICDNEEPLLGDNLDMSVPHILYRTKEGFFESGNKIGLVKSLLLVPQNWMVNDGSRYTIHKYTWGETSFQGIEIDENFNDTIVVSGPDGTISFGADTPLYWTKQLSRPIYQPYVVEPIYNVEKCRFALCYDTVNRTVTLHSPKVQFRNKYETNWSSIPGYGDIFVRAIDDIDNYVTPARFINVGDELVVTPIYADKDSCQIRVTWAHGRVITTEGTLKSNDVWEVNKADCKNPSRIRFTFIPSDNSHNQFNLSIRAPFKHFSIVNQNGVDVANNEYIPFSDVDKYQYHLMGQDILAYQFGNIIRKLEWFEDKLYIKENGKRIKQIPYEGSLLTLFDSRENLWSLLERTSKKMLDAEIIVTFQITRTKSLKFYIKDSPFRVRQDDIEHVYFISPEKSPRKNIEKKRIDYKGRIKLLPFDNPKAEPVIVSYDKEAGFVLPEKILPWGKSLLFGYTRGRICPGLVDRSKLWEDKERWENFQETNASVALELESAVLGSTLWNRIIGWFQTAQENDIPSSSIIELNSVAQRGESLLCLAFTLFALSGSEDNRKNLASQMTSFSSDNGFQWYWLLPYTGKMMMILQSFVNDTNCPMMKDIYFNWVIDHEHDDLVRYLAGMKDDYVYETYIGQCLAEVSVKFSNWIDDLMINSMVETYGISDDETSLILATAIVKESKNLCEFTPKNKQYIDLKQDYINGDVERFFNDFYEKGTRDNEMWFHKRVNAVADHFKKKTLFGKSDEIRRSIIYCCKSCNSQFIIALNNKLVGKIS